MDLCVRLHWEFSLCIVSAKGLLNKASTEQVKQRHSQLKWRNKQSSLPGYTPCLVQAKKCPTWNGTVRALQIPHPEKERDLDKLLKDNGERKGRQIVWAHKETPQRQSTLWAQPPLLFQAGMQSAGLHGSYRCSGHYRAATTGLMPLCKLANWSLKKLLWIYPRFLEGRI